MLGGGDGIRVREGLISSQFSAICPSLLCVKLPCSTFCKTSGSKLTLFPSPPPLHPLPTPYLFG